MILFTTFILTYFTLSAIADWAMINKKSDLWHWLRAGIDLCILLFVAWLLAGGIRLPNNWETYAFVVIFGLTIRDMSRTILLGIGTTSWMDRHIAGFYRLCIWMLGLFLSACYFIWFAQNKEMMERFL